MGSPCALVLRGSDKKFNAAITTKIEIEITRLEARYSRFLPESLTTTINRHAGTGQAIGVDEECASLLDYADTCFQQSDGLFDITSGSLRKLWNYQVLTAKNNLPSDKAISDALLKVGWEKVCWNNGEIALPVAGMEIDFGGIVKEYAADCVASLAEREGVESGMVELGGDIRLFGIAAESTPEQMIPEQLSVRKKARQQENKRAEKYKYAPWQIGIRDPFKTEQARALIDLRYGGLATSGDYERYSIIQGKKFSHILNPLTGWPVEGFHSVSVIADQCVIAGTAASIAVLKGRQGEQWLAELGLPYLCIDQEGQVSGTIKNAKA